MEYVSTHLNDTIVNYDEMDEEEVLRLKNVFGERLVEDLRVWDSEMSQF